MHKLKVIPIGNSLGIVLPEEALAKLQADMGDDVLLVETAHGLMLISYRQALEQQLDAAGKSLKKYHNALQELAK